MTAFERKDAAAPKPLRADTTTLAVFAPFGTDPVLSTYPEGETRTAAGHPLVAHLAEVARAGVRVMAYLDRLDDQTWQVEIAPGAGRPVLTSLGKLDMQSGETLAQLLRAAHAAAPDNDCVLSLEGHGAGFLPDLDLKVLAQEGMIRHGGDPVLPGGSPTSLQFRTGDPVLPGGSPTSSHGANAFADPVLPGGSPTSLQFRTGDPVLPGGSPTSFNLRARDPVLPGGSPTSRNNPSALPGGLPNAHAAMATAQIALGLQQAKAGGARVRVVHFASCFNMSVELLHTVSPYAEYATGYCNYNFFSAGKAYPGVFQGLAAAVGGLSAESVARSFAARNHAVLLAEGHEPTVAGTVALSRMHDIVEKVDDLSDDLLACLRSASAAERPGYVERIRQAIVAAQQYDSRPDFVLGAPDELTDLDSLAYELSQVDFAPFKVQASAAALHRALRRIKQYGDVGAPWMAEGDAWDFSSKNLAMNIFLPDPLRKGLWDWRSLFYLDVNPDPSKPQVQRNIIDFVKVTDWVDFLREYHKGIPFISLKPVAIPRTPLLRSDFDPRHPAKPAALRERRASN